MRTRWVAVPKAPKIEIAPELEELVFYNPEDAENATWYIQPTELDAEGYALNDEWVSTKEVFKVMEAIK